MKPTNNNSQSTTIPQHIAIIMDGNRRWAKAHGKHPLVGHKYVVDQLLEQLVEHASTKGIKYMTFWAWSTENWKRTQEEVGGILKLFKYVLSKSLETFHKNGVRMQVIGNIEAFPQDIRQGIKEGVEKTKNNTKITVIIALNYGGRDEIIRAVNKALSVKRLAFSEEIAKEEFEFFLDTQGIPDPELIIRTGGEKRLSGFLLWQSEYAELYFTDTLMPDFTPEKLDEALLDFSQRKRRFGK